MVKHMEITEALTEAARGRRVDKNVYMYAHIVVIGSGHPFINLLHCGAYELLEEVLLKLYMNSTWQTFTV